MDTDLRTERRVTRLTIDNAENITVCELPCRNDFLVDLAVPGALTNRSVYRSRGTAEVTVAWSGRTHHIEWARSTSAAWCDQCGDEWRRTIPAAVAAARANAQRGKQRWAALTPEERAASTARLANRT